MDERDETYRAYWRALQHRVCAVCLERRHDGTCGIPKQRVCGLMRHLPLLVDVVHNVDSGRMDDYLDAVEREVCSRCPDDHPLTGCAYRDEASCALYTYLPRVLDAIDAVDEERRRRRKR